MQYTFAKPLVVGYLPLDFGVDELDMRSGFANDNEYPYVRLFKHSALTISAIVTVSSSSLNTKRITILNGK